MTELESRIKIYEKQERLLRFESFSNEDAWELGCLMVKEAQDRGLKPALSIVKNGYTVFRYGFDGTNTHNDMWLERKHNTVQVTHMSSLHVGAVLEKNGETIGDDWYLDPAKHAFLGGGFPLILKGTGVIGSVCCSGLPHLEDHAMVVRCIARFLKLDENSLFVE